jgi:hypothetical protein
MTICAYKMTWVAACISLMAVVLPNTGALRWQAVWAA